MFRFEVIESIAVLLYKYYYIGKRISLLQISLFYRTFQLCLVQRSLFFGAMFFFGTIFSFLIQCSIFLVQCSLLFGSMLGNSFTNILRDKKPKKRTSYTKVLQLFIKNCKTKHPSSDQTTPVQTKSNPSRFVGTGGVLSELGVFRRNWGVCRNWECFGGIAVR